MHNTVRNEVGLFFFQSILHISKPFRLMVLSCIQALAARLYWIYAVRVTQKTRFLQLQSEPRIRFVFGFIGAQQNIAYICLFALGPHIEL